MTTDSLVLQGRHIRLEPLDRQHTDGLAGAAAVDPSLYRWSPVPQRKAETAKYVETALAWKEAGSAVPYAIIRMNGERMNGERMNGERMNGAQMNDDLVLGSTRFWNLERWAWPPGHPSHGRVGPDACEIGHTWLTQSAIRTGANTEAKLLMLTHAFEVWQVLRVCFHTDARNQRSRAALERIGGQCEGILRAHRMAADFIPRDSVRYSIVAAEWPTVKERLLGFLDRS
jgi:RimJ/RimL family protein N-acetyltransferase